MPNSRLFALGLCLWLAVPLQASAQDSVDLERFRLASSAVGFLDIEGTRTPGPAMWTATLAMDYASNLLSVTTADGRELDLVDDRATAAFGASLGVGGRAVLGMQMAVVMAQDGESLDAAGPELRSAAFQDPRVTARYRVLGESALEPDHHKDGPGLALQAAFDLPVGSPEGYVGESATRMELSLLADIQLLGYGLGAQLGWRHRFANAQLLGAEFGDQLLFGAALKLPVPMLSPLVSVLELRGATDFQSGATTAVEGELAFRGPLTDDVTLVVALGTGLSAGVGAPSVRVLTGLWWVPQNPDTDLDGIPDDKDECPFLAEDKDGFQDRDGCEDPDNDNDLIPDVDDLCPNEEALEDQDDDEDGCTDT